MEGRPQPSLDEERHPQCQKSPFAAAPRPPNRRGTKAKRIGSPRWLAPAMVTCFVLGLAWVVVYYITQTNYPIEAASGWETWASASA